MCATFPPWAYQARHLYRRATLPLTSDPIEIHRIHIRTMHIYDMAYPVSNEFWSIAIDTLASDMRARHADDMYVHPSHGGVWMGPRFRFFVYDYDISDLRPLDTYDDTIYEMPRDAHILESMRSDFNSDHLGFWYRAVDVNDDLREMGYP